jgi:hypothetical protein
MNFSKKNHLALLAGALLAIPGLSVAENLIDIQDPSGFIHKATLEVSIYDGDPAAGTNSGPQQCFAFKAIDVDESNRWAAMKKRLEIDPSLRYRFRCSVFTDGEALISVLGSAFNEERETLTDPDGRPFVYTLKPEDGKVPIKAPTDGWVLLEVIVGPGEALDWPAGTMRTNFAINITKAEPETVVYVKDLSVEEMR